MRPRAFDWVPGTAPQKAAHNLTAMRRDQRQAIDINQEILEHMRYQSHMLRAIYVELKEANTCR